MAKNGVELLVRARVTVRTNLAQLIGGATEETIIARVGEGIITSIGSAKDHLQVMENPDRISKAVLERGLDAHTAFEIVSIDIADIDVGENIGARLQADQAEADTRKAQALAETRRADAIAREQEMKARGGAQSGGGAAGRGGRAARRWPKRFAAAISSGSRRMGAGKSQGKVPSTQCFCSPLFHSFTARASPGRWRRTAPRRALRSPGA